MPNKQVTDSFRFTKLDLKFVEPDLVHELLGRKEGFSKNGKLPGILFQPERNGDLQFGTKVDEALLQFIPEAVPLIAILSRSLSYKSVLYKKPAVQCQMNTLS